MPIKHTNFASSKLAVGIGSGDVTLSVTGTHGDRFPVLGAGDHCYLVIENATKQREIVKATARTVDTFTVVRGQDDTTAQAWVAGDTVSLRFVKAAIDDSIGNAVQRTSATGSAILPTGTTAQRDGAPAVGYTRANSTIGALEWYNGTTWQSIGADFLNTARIDVASAATVNLTTGAPSTRNINITGTTTITGFTVAVGQVYFVRFSASLTLTNNAAIITQRGANITTSAGDTCIIRATAANTVEVLGYAYAGIVPDGVITPAKLSQPLTRGTAVNTTSGTSVAFSGGSIPSWINRLTLSFNSVSSSGTSGWRIQLGTGGTPTTAGYDGASGRTWTGGPSANAYSTGFDLNVDTAAFAFSGAVVFTHMGGNLWVVSGSIGSASSTTMTITLGGKIALSGVLDYLILRTVNGTDTFDAGSVNILYE